MRRGCGREVRDSERGSDMGSEMGSEIGSEMGSGMTIILRRNHGGFLDSVSEI